MENQPQQDQNIQQPVLVRSTTSNTPIKPQKAFKKWLLILLVIIFVLLIPLEGYLLLGKMGIKSKSSKITVSTPTPAKIQNIDTTNWKIYKSQKYGFTFKYTKNWSLIENKTFNENSIYDFDHALVTLNFKPDPLLGVSISIYPNSGQLTAKQFIKNYFNNENNDASGNPIDPELKDVTFTNSVINGNEVTSIDGLMTIVGRQGRKVWITHGKTGYLLSVSAIVGTDEFKTLDDLLSTFNFIDQISSPTCIPRPKCLNTTPRCMITETKDLCPPNITP